MARNLIGYFAGQPDCTQYSVKIISDPSNDTFEEIHLAGDSPFVVTYDTTETPFEPVRFSRASINVVADEKFFDVFSEDVQGTQVILTNDETESVEWVGYLTSNLLNMPDASCGAETFTLEAQDCLSTLDSFDYTNRGTKKAIVSFREILATLMMRCGLVNTLYVDKTMLKENGDNISVDQLRISEQNFYSSDTDEPWTMREVLTEICRYLGYTAIQYKDAVYLYDMQSHAADTWQTDTEATLYVRFDRSIKENEFLDTWDELINEKGITLRQAIFRGGNADISLETLYNKVVVKDSFYEIDHFIPDIYEDNSLTNRLGDFWKCNQIGSSAQFKFINKNGYSKKEEKSEGDYLHYIRKFDHKDYQSVYRNPNTLSPVTVNNSIKLSNIWQGISEDPENAEGTYSINATFKNTDSVSHTIYVQSTLRYDWWDDSEMMSDYNTNTTSDYFTLAAGASRDLQLQVTSSWNDEYGAYSTYYTSYSVDGSGDYSLSNSSDDTKNYVGGTIVDIATFDKPMDTTQYNYETEANINFDRYLMIHQADKPSGIMHPYWNYIFILPLNPLKDSEIETYFPCIFKLKDNYTNPFIYSNNTYLYLDATAIYERYNVEWINPDWATENSRDNGLLGHFNRTSNITTTVPALIFKLKVGNKYWSSQSGWTTTDSCFVVNLGTDKLDNDKVDFSAWWNKDHPVLNNVSWTDWAGCKGYKIPLETGLDMNQPIIFQVHLPSRIQEVDTRAANDGMNNYCWVKDLKLGITTKDRENYDMADVVYENIISESSVNTLSDITCKITTYPGNGMHSYSNVGIGGGLLIKMKKVGLDNVANRPEENIIKAYANQYSSPTIKQNMTLDLGATPFSRIKDPILEKYFGIIGQRYDYAKGRQEITLIETKTWHMG